MPEPPSLPSSSASCPYTTPCVRPFTPYCSAPKSYLHSTRVWARTHNLLLKRESYMSGHHGPSNLKNQHTTPHQRAPCSTIQSPPPPTSAQALPPQPSHHPHAHHMLRPIPPYSTHTAPTSTTTTPVSTTSLPPTPVLLPAPNTCPPFRQSHLPTLAQIFVQNLRFSPTRTPAHPSTHKIIRHSSVGSADVS